MLVLRRNAPLKPSYMEIFYAVALMRTSLSLRTVTEEYSTWQNGTLQSSRQSEVAFITELPEASGSASSECLAALQSTAAHQKYR